MRVRCSIDTYQQDLDAIMLEANAVLNRFSVGEYFVLRADPEYTGNRHFDSIRGPITYVPQYDVSGTDKLSFHEVFWANGHYADSSIGRIREPITCLCKVILNQKASKANGEWSFPHLYIENVATHQQFDFCSVMCGKCSVQPNASKLEIEEYQTITMPYLLTVKAVFSIHSGVFGKRVTRTLSIEDRPVYVGTALQECTNAEVAAHLKHIAKVLERERQERLLQEKEKREQDAIDSSVLERLYKQLGE